MIKVNEWVIDADSRCYIIGKPKQRTTKDGKVEDYLADQKYYPTLAGALNGIREALRRDLVRSRDMTLDEALEKIPELDAEIRAAFEGSFPND
jgi:hypothetical protein